MDSEELKQEIREGSEDFIKGLCTVILLAEMENTGWGAALIEVLREELDTIEQKLSKV